MRRQIAEIVQRIKKNKQGSFLLFVPEREIDRCVEVLQRELMPEAEHRTDWIVPESLGANEIREALKRMHEKPLFDFKVFVLPFFNLANKVVQNSLLKSLEEAKVGQVYILLASSEEGILRTILSRCQRFYLSSHRSRQAPIFKAKDLSEWMTHRPRDREKLRDLLSSWLRQLSDKDPALGQIILKAYLQAKKINVNLDLFWLNLFITLKRLKQL